MPEQADGHPDLATLRTMVERHFQVYEAREEKVQGVVAASLFYVMFPQHEFDRRYQALREEMQALDEELLVFLRREGGEDILFVARRPHVGPIRSRTNLILMVLTLLTTASAGALYWQGYMHAGDPWSWSALWRPENLLWGTLTFALPLMLILGIHETAHFIAAKRHGLRATLPYFIPVPPGLFFPIGTLGAFIRLKDPLPDRKALFDVGASGPLAGFAVALPLLLVGSFLTGDVAMEVPDLDRPAIDAADFDIQHDDTGEAVLTLRDVTAGTYLWQVSAPDGPLELSAQARVEAADGTVLQEDDTTIRLGDGETRLYTLRVPDGAAAARITVTWDDHLVEFGDPLLVTLLDGVYENGRYLTHPTFFAAWVGLLVTGINLLPAGQLDGGHVARAVLGERVRWAALASLALLMFLSFRFTSWILMALFLVLTGLYHPPPLNDRTRLDSKRIAVAVGIVLVFALTFVPVPIKL